MNGIRTHKVLLGNVDWPSRKSGAMQMVEVVDLDDHKAEIERLSIDLQQATEHRLADEAKIKAYEERIKAYEDRLKAEKALCADLIKRINKADCYVAGAHEAIAAAQAVLNALRTPQ